MIPGSSLKGSMRTALFVNFLQNQYKSSIPSEILKDYRQKFSDHSLTRKLFGETPNTDFSRMFRITDFHFKKETEIWHLQIINYMRDGWAIKPGTDQLAETISQGKEASGEIYLNHFLMDPRYSHITGNKFGKWDELKLISLMNAHTSYLLQYEIEVWEERGEEEALGPIEDYLDTLKKLQEDTDSCQENQAVMRVGFGSGWTYLTGNWAKDDNLVDNDSYYGIMNACRHKRYPEDIPFPKTRKQAKGGSPLGFIKLEIS
jgi:CRISPR type III-A-associated RAMP protein Csm5